MKRMTCLLCALTLLLLAACGGKKEAAVDYGSSELYTKEDMDAAVKVIREKFDTWEGCELHAIRYGGDAQCTEENLRWLDEHMDDGTEFAGCAMFLSDFHSPKSSAKAGAFNVDFEYTDWQWWLGRTAGGDWVLVDWGY